MDVHILFPNLGENQNNDRHTDDGPQFSSCQFVHRCPLSLFASHS